MKNKDLILKMAQIGILTALSMVFYMLRFPIAAIFPEFLDIQFSNIPPIIGGLALGPIEGSIIVIIRFFLKLLSTSTRGIGEMADLIIGLTVVLSSSLIYRINRTKSGGRIALIASFLTWVSVSVAANYLILIPTYIQMYGYEAVLGLCPDYLNITPDSMRNKLTLASVLPFNILLAGITCTITFFVYKRVSLLFQRMNKE